MSPGYPSPTLLCDQRLVHLPSLHAKRMGAMRMVTTEANTQHADDTTLMAESEELKSLLMKVKEESGKVGLKLNT